MGEPAVRPLLIVERVLLIEDDRDDYLLTRDMLAEIPGNHYQLDWISDYDAALKALQACEHDICLLDYRLGARSGLDLLRDARAADCNAAIIMLTGADGHEIDVAAQQAGASDFLEKSGLDSVSLDRAIRYALRHKRQQEELAKRVAERTLELALVNGALQDSSRRKDEFLATLAHELRGPLAPLSNMLEIIKRTDGNGADNGEVIRQARATMERQLSQLTRLVDDLLDLNRMTYDKMELRTAQVELASVLQHAIDTCRPAIEAARHELTVKLPSQPIYLEADAARLVQLFTNLLNNACKYSEPGGRISLTAERQAAEVMVTVKDSGIGIAAEILPNIFEMFTQAGSVGSSDHAQGGLGIGLTLVRRLVVMHGGSVTAQSQGLGRGSEFVVRLPIAESAKVAPFSARSAEEPVRLSAHRILVVDDNRDSALSMAMLLKMTGNETCTAFDGLEAVSAAAAFRPDIALLDMGLPRQNGCEVARQIRQQPWGQSMVLVALTGWGQEEDRRKSSEAGFDAHLVKPVDPATLTRLLAELVSEKEGAKKSAAS